MASSKFRQWLMGFKGHNTLYGDMATAVSLDEWTKLLPDTRERWVAHIDPLGTGTFKIVNELFDLFESGEEPESPIKLGRRSILDDDLAIIPPTIPNYTGRRSTLLRVFVRPEDVVEDHERLISSYIERREPPSMDYLAVSGRVHGEAAEQLARYFRREFGYDFLSYTWGNHLKSRRGIGDRTDAFLFITNEHSIRQRAIGAACFLQPKGSSRWILNFVYFHPQFRRRGMLSKAWSLFQYTYGDFWASHPLSDAMESFIKKRGEMDRHAGSYRRG